MSILITKISTNRVKIDNDGQILGFSPSRMNVFSHPNENKIIITTAGSPQAHLNGPASGLMLDQEDVTTPVSTDKQNLVDILITTIFN